MKARPRCSVPRCPADLEIIRILLDAGADPDVVTAEQERSENDVEYDIMPPGQTTPLMAAAGVGWRDTISRGRDADAIEALKIFLELGGDINKGNQAGDTPLHGAALRGSVAIIEFLVANGADVVAQNARGWTPLDIALGQPRPAHPLQRSDHHRPARAHADRRGIVERGRRDFQFRGLDAPTDLVRTMVPGAGFRGVRLYCDIPLPMTATNRFRIPCP